MAWVKVKTRVAAGGIALLAIGVATLIKRSSTDPWGQGRLRLPVGSRTPAISLGERHGLILASDGSLWSWGSDFLGWPVLGLANLETNSPGLKRVGSFGKPETMSTSLRRIGSETNWVSISAGSSHNLAVKSDGTLWTWGQSVTGPSGRPVPINAPVPAAPGNDWRQAAAGGIHSVALKTDGTLWAWGNNWAGSLGVGSNKGSSTPLQIGSGTNWTKVWASTLETVAMQSDGSLWYWGDNPNPAVAQGAGQIFVPMRISPDTNWVDVGFGVNTVFAIKSDGTLWAWGRNAEAYTGTSDLAQDATPARVGTNSDWRSISACAGWWCQGLIKKDGSLWMMDASDSKPNGPRTPYKPARFRRVELQKDYVAYAAGAVHAAPAGVHGPIGVLLTRDGEVWTWGMVLGDPPTIKGRAESLAAKLANGLHFKFRPGDPDPLFRNEPWQLRNVQPDAPAK